MFCSVPRNIDHKGEHLSQCDVCGVMYLRSALRRGRDGLLRCENDRDGRDALTLAELTAARASALSQRLGRQSSADGAVPDASPTRTPLTPFTPTDISAVSAWLSVANATHDSNGVSSLPDLMNVNPAVQSVDARKPVIELSVIGLPCMRFATNDVLTWPITPQSAATNYAGWGFWFKPDSLAAVQRLIRTATGTNGANGNKLTLNTSAGTGINVSASSTGSGTGVKQYTSANGLLTTSWQFLTLEYDKDAATDAARLLSTINGVTVAASVVGSQDISAGLFAATGNTFIGNGADGVASAPFDGLFGPNIYAFSSKMAGATTGLLTTEARASLMMYHHPTLVPPRLPGNGPYTGPTRRLTVADVYADEIPTYVNPYTAVNKPGF